MKTDRSLGKPVLALVVAANALLALLVWKSRSHDRPSEQTVAEAPAATQPATETRSAAAAASPVEPPAQVSSVATTGLPPVVPIPLAPVLTDAENGSWLRGKDYLLVP